MKTVQQLLMQQPLALWSIAPDDTVFNALKIMAEARVSGLLVMDKGKLIGILTERDYARKIALEGKSSKDARVRDIMTSEIICVRSETTNEECMALMSSRNIRHLPVVNGSEVIGMLSMPDLLADIISEREYTIQQLEHYIHD
jgi:CBS domain-containing protein